MHQQKGVCVCVCVSALMNEVLNMSPLSFRTRIIFSAK